MKTAIIITIGDEILIGQTVDTNSAWMGNQLSLIGIDVLEIVSISDTPEHITKTLDHALKQADLVFTTGGLGPTQDDLTKETLAAYFGREMEEHPFIMEQLVAYFKKRKRPLTEQGKKIAMMPKDTRLFLNHKGTAPAMWFEKDDKVVVAMPGVPYEMKKFMSEDILPDLKAKGMAQTIVHKTIMVAGVGETVVAEKIKDIEAALPEHIKLAYLPNLGVLRLRLSAKGGEEKALTAEVEGFANQIVETIPDWVYGYDNKPLEEAIGDLLKERSAKLVIAESCTGGKIAAQLVSVPGSSSYFEGGVVAYSYEMKAKMLDVSWDTLETKGAVSQEAVEEMAKGALKNMDADFVIATSGIAGPGGGTPDKPVGTIWMAVASKENIKSKKFQLTDHRDINIGLTTNLALNELRRFILRHYPV